jgi:diguanylate cyclase (GGDEF)-like protein/PAS domain S-box-containing protein
MPTDAVPEVTSRPSRRRAGMWPAWIAVACALALTFVAWRDAREDFEQRLRREFDAEARQLQAGLGARIGGYSRVLRAATALFAASDEVTRKDWRDFVGGLHLGADYPGLQAMSFARVVDSAERRAAMQLAQTSGAPAITGRVAPAGSGAVGSGFEMILAVPAKSGNSVQGYIVATIAMGPMMQDLVADGARGIALSIHDGTDLRLETLLYRSAEAGASSAKLVRSEVMTVGGRPWTVSYASLPALEARADATRSLQVLAGGLLTSMLLFTIAWSVATTRDRALRQAREMTGSLRESEARLRVLVDSAPDAIVVYDVDQARFIDANSQAEALFGCSREEITRGSAERFYPPGLFDGKTASENVAEMIQRALLGEQLVFDRTLRNAQGQLVRCEMRLVRLPSTTRRLVRGSFIDITERKRAEADLRVAAITFESQDGVMITDAAASILRVNRAFTEITGYDAAEAVGQKPSMLKSGRHDAAFYAGMQEAIERDGTWRGEIWNRRKNGEIYPSWANITAVKNPRGFTTHYVTTFADITQRRAAEDEIRHLAFYDPLTGLPNRRLMLERLRQALAGSARHGRHGALLLFDLDDFKTLNDSLGHDVGDQFLVEVARRLASSIREVDMVARLGGDEFVVILEDLDAEATAAMQAESVAVKIQAALNEPYLLDLSATGGELNTRSYHCTASIGVSLFRDQSVSVDDLMKRADTAMYQAKAGGRNTLRFFDPEMQAAVAARAVLDTDLRRAVATSQFVLHYQRQVDGDGRLVGAEALLRWQHPRRGLVLPGEFIRQTEESRLIMPLGSWVLETACQQLASWATDAAKGQVSLAVNVSSRQFHQPDFVDQVLGLLAATGADPRLLKLEVTESLLLQDIEDVVAKMARLREAGVSFSLDDFGTGYSSLYYLKRLPLSQLKIDQSFVRDILSDGNDAAIARTVIALGRSLGLEVIAEGVETEAQRDFLARHGCHAFQGNLFGMPVAAEELFRRQPAGAALEQ